MLLSWGLHIQKITSRASQGGSGQDLTAAHCYQTSLLPCGRPSGHQQASAGPGRGEKNAQPPLSLPSIDNLGRSSCWAEVLQEARRPEQHKNGQTAVVPGCCKDPESKRRPKLQFCPDRAFSLPLEREGSYGVSAAAWCARPVPETL